MYVELTTNPLISAQPLTEILNNSLKHLPQYYLYVCVLNVPRNSQLSATSELFESVASAVLRFEYVERNIDSSPFAIPKNLINTRHVKRTF